MATTHRRLSSLPFPTVGLFAIYSSTDLPDKQPSPADDDADPHSDGDDHAEEGSRAKPDEQAQELAKVVFWYSQVEDLSVDRKARLVGTIRGMQDFARSVGGRALASILVLFGRGS